MGSCDPGRHTGQTDRQKMNNPETPLFIDKLGKEPVNRCCPVCKNQAPTKVTRCVRMPIGWLLILIFFPIGLLVLCCDTFKEFKHTCSLCGFPLGSYEQPYSIRACCALCLCCACCQQNNPAPEYNRNLQFTGISRV